MAAMLVRCCRPPPETDALSASVPFRQHMPENLRTMQTLSVRVACKRTEATGIVSLELTDELNRELPMFAPGSHIDVHIKPGLVRQYSLCNHPNERSRYVIAVLQDPQSRGGSLAVHRDVKEGDLLQISAPRNLFPLLPAPHSIMLAGGIGVTPLICMAEHLCETNASFEMHYCARSVESMAFQERIRGAAYSQRTRFYLDTGPPSSKLDLKRLLLESPHDSHLYVCGPRGFIEWAIETARELAWSQDRLHVEFFNAATVQTTDRSFEVQIASTGQVFDVPGDRSATEVLAVHGHQIPVSCEQGVCGTCLTRVLAGEPDHRDMYLSDAERARNDQFTPCCSRAKGTRLVLDL